MSRDTPLASHMVFCLLENGGTTQLVKTVVHHLLWLWRELSYV